MKSGIGGPRDPGPGNVCLAGRAWMALDGYSTAFYHGGLSEGDRASMVTGIGDERRLRE